MGFRASSVAMWPLLLLLLAALAPWPTQTAELEFDKEDAAAISRFKDYLRIQSVHPSPDYASSTKFLVSLAAEQGLDSKVLELVPGKPLVLMSWQGSSPELPSILLNSHVDVVPAEPTKWKLPPFEAQQDEQGNIFGRGSQDMKCVGMQYLEALRRLRSSGFSPVRSIYLSFVPEEEVGGDHGVGVFVESEEFRSLNLGLVLDEGLASETDDYRVFYAERAPWWLVVKAEGRPGHGSKMFDHSALENLAKSMEAIARFRESQFDLVKAGLAAEGEVISVNPVFLKAGTPTPAGFVMNLQPSEAEAGFDIRLPPFADTAAMEKRISDEWAPASRNMTFRFKQKTSVRRKDGALQYTPLDNSNPWWPVFEAAVAKSSKKMAKPEIFPAATDARYFRDYGIPAIGFSPMSNTPVLLHDHNEFLSALEFIKGIEVYQLIISSLANFVDQDGGVDHSEL